MVSEFYGIFCLNDFFEKTEVCFFLIFSALNSAASVTDKLLDNCSLGGLGAYSILKVRLSRFSAKST